MTLAEFAVVALSAIGTLGGVTIIAGAVAKIVSNHTSRKWLQDNQGKLDQSLETHRAELAKETEVHKLKLKRQELLFEREIEAADAFMALWRKVWPQYSHPNMEYSEACESVADRIGAIETLLEDYLEHHSVAISDQVRAPLEHARWIAAAEKFHVIANPASPPPEAIDAAGQVLDAMKSAREKVLSDLRR